MLPEKLTIQDDFPPVTYQQWRELAEASLDGASFEQKLVTHTYEGIDIQPVYSPADGAPHDVSGFPGLPPFVRGSHPLGAVRSGWDLRQEHAHPDLKVANHEMLADLKCGVSSLLLRLDAAARQGLDPDDQRAEGLAGQDGLMAYCVDDLDQALDEVYLNMVGIALDAGAAFVPAAALLAALWSRRKVSADQAQGAFNADPIGVLAREGRLPTTAGRALQLLGELARWTSQTYPRVTTVGVDTAPYHHAGATAAQDIAFAAATGVEYLRTMTAAGLDVDAAARQIVFRISLGTHHFLSIAKLRAGRRLWSRVVEASGGTPGAGAMRIHARTSLRVLTRRDPYVNLLRNTVATFAAGVGGAEAITSLPLDAMTGLPSDFSRRIARNTLLILQEEAHLNRVIDPAGGSWFLEQLTEQVADKAWGILQDVERQGGMLKALQSGWVAGQIDSAFAPRAKDIARRKEGITGVSEFPNVQEEKVLPRAADPDILRETAAARVAQARAQLAKSAVSKGGAQPLSLDSSQPLAAAAVAAAEKGASIGQLAAAIGLHDGRPAEIPSLELRSFAEPYEELRDASDDHLAAHGQRPRVFLANMGPVAHYTARAAYSKNFFEAGGFEVIGDAGFDDAEQAAEALAASGANIAVICSSDKLYPDLVPQVAPRLKQAGARTVVLAGNPAANEQNWRAAGVDRFIFIKCDVLAALRELLQEEGVLSS